jgi:23S rRNA (cytosine1962-C5)-methyltransferase
MRTLVLEAGRAKPLWQGHPWVFADSVARVEGDAGDAADWVRVADAEGRIIGHGFASEGSAIRVRLLVRGDEAPQPDAVLGDRIARAAALRRRLFPDPERTDAYRLVHADGDGVPGLIVDRLGDVLVAQFATRPMHARREALGERLIAETGASALLARAAGFEEVEGIPEDDVAFALGAAIPERVAIREEGLHLEAQPRAGQKTGHYADQRENRLLVGRMAAGQDVLDLYAGTGGFSLQALRHGARSAEAVDASARCIESVARHADLNGVAARCEAVRADVRAHLAALRSARRRFGLVVVDPPNFMPRRGSDRGALRAYRELNVRALSRVEPDGFLATFTCSAKLRAGPFLELLRSASRECRRGFDVLRELGAGPDHPVAPGLPEGRYLSGLLLRVHA